MKIYDAIVLGTGAMGSAATYQLAKAGIKVLGIDRYKPPHTFGSSHGDTRLTRQAIADGPEYVPLVMRSHQIWRDIETQTGYDLLNQCGSLMMSIPGVGGPRNASDFLSRNVATAKQFNIEHKVLSNKQIKDKYPQFRVDHDEQGYFESSAGFLRPEKCIEAQLNLAAQHGAEVRFDEQVIAYTTNDSTVKIKTNRNTYQAAKLVISAGSWINEIVPEFRNTFKVYRQVLYWFDLKDKPAYESYNKLPGFLWQFGQGNADYIYGFPMIDGSEGGMKVATHNYSRPTSPDSMERQVSETEARRMHTNYVKEQLPGLSSKCIRATTCLYTVTPDNDFVIDFHPAHKNVIVSSPCSGHGFKYSAAIGEILAELVTTGSSKLDISKFSINRFS